MTMIVFAALTALALAIAWGTVAAALRQSHQEQVATKEAGPECSCPLTSACGDRRRVGRRGVKHFRARAPTHEYSV